MPAPSSIPDFSWRTGLARDVAGHYARRPGFSFAMLGGSVARGESDAWSDLDILIYWDRVDVAWLETPPLEGEGARRFTWRNTFPDEVWLEQYRIGAQKIDVAHATVSWWERIVGEVVDGADATDWKQGTLGGFLEAIPLAGEAVFASWRERVARYPDALAKKMIEANLFFYPTWFLEHQGLEREDRYVFHDMLLEMLRHLMGVLAGLNRTYFSTDKFKRIGATADRFEIRPPDAGARLEALFHVPAREAVRELGALVNETLDLVDAHRPDVDTARARRVFALTFEGCTERPAFRGPS